MKFDNLPASAASSRLRRNRGALSIPLHRRQRQHGFQPAMVRALRACALSDRSREFAPLLIDGADRSGIILGDDEHRWSMGTHPTAGGARVGL